MPRMYHDCKLARNMQSTSSQVIQSQVDEEAMALKSSKNELRARMKAALSAVSQESINRQTISSLNSLFRLPEYQSARSISVFLSMPTGEISTQGIVHSAMHQNKKVFIPYTYKLQEPARHAPASVMDMVQLQSLEDYQTLEADRWGIPTPSAESIPKRMNAFGGLGKSQGSPKIGSDADVLDVIVMPGMAFDKRLQRLGHGKGYYDYFLQRYQEATKAANSKMPFLVGLSLEEQLLPEEDHVPSDKTDYQLDALILGSGEILRRGAAQ